LRSFGEVIVPTLRPGAGHICDKHFANGDRQANSGSSAASRSNAARFSSLKHACRTHPADDMTA
jgi:hypothetical protein